MDATSLPTTGSGHSHSIERRRARTGSAAPRAAGRDARSEVSKHGQTLLFFSVTLSAVMLSLLFLYRAAMMTTAKMEVKNAADAVAMTVSTLEARDLNFTSYMNRAMVANEVAIGQFVGLNSWIDHLATLPHNMDRYMKVICPRFGLLAPGCEGAWRGVQGPMISVTRGLRRTSPRILGPGVNGLSAINGNTYGWAAYGNHFVTTFLQIPSVVEPWGNPLVEQNAPGAIVSPYGFLMAGWHAKTYWEYAVSHDPTVDDTDTQKAYKEFAAVVRDSRDQFVADRGWQLPLSNLVDLLGALGADVDGDVFPGFPLSWRTLLDCPSPVGNLIFPAPPGTPPFICVRNKLSGERRGGSELRFKGGKAKGEAFTWSAVDTIALDMNVEIDIIDVDVPLIGPFLDFVRSTLGLPYVLPLPGSFLTNGMSQAGQEDWLGRTDWDDLNPGPAPADRAKIDASYGGHVRRVSANPHEWQWSTFGNSFPPHQEGQDHGPAQSGGTTIGVGSSGRIDGATMIDAWPAAYGPTPLPPPAAIGLQPRFQLSSQVGFYPALHASGPTKLTSDEKTKDKYKGLPRFTSTGDGADEAKLGAQAPYFLAAVIKDTSADGGFLGIGPHTFGQDDRVFGAGSVQTTGALDPLLDGRGAPHGEGAANVVAAISRSEVYFSRPNDLAWFKRWDDYEEHGSAFSPYWQPRLVETSWYDRAIALLGQQGVVYLEDTSSLLNDTPIFVQSLLGGGGP